MNWRFTSPLKVRWSEDGHCYPIHSQVMNYQCYWPYHIFPSWLLDSFDILLQGPCAQGLVIDISKWSCQPQKNINHALNSQQLTLSSLKTTDNPPPHHHNPLFRSSMEPECLPNVCTAGTFYDSVNTKKEATKMLSSNIPGVLLWNCVEKWPTTGKHFRRLSRLVKHSGKLSQAGHQV